MIQLKSKDIKKVRKQLLEAQDGKCQVCGLEIPHGDDVLDHKHRHRLSISLGENGAGLVRGVLCRSCNIIEGKVANAFLRTGKFKDGVPLSEILRGLADYLEKPTTDMIHPTEQAKPPKLMKSSYNQLKKAMNGDGHKIPEYTGRLTKKLIKLYSKYDIEPKLKGNNEKS